MNVVNNDRNIYKSVLSCLGYGKSNAISSKRLIKLNGLTERELRKVVEIIRRSGVCVISDESGYYFPETRNELEKYIKRTRKMASSIFDTLETAQKKLENFDETEKTQ